MIERPESSRQVLVARQLIDKIIRRLVELQLFNQRAAVIEVDKHWLRINREGESLLFLRLNHHTLDARSTGSSNLNLNRHSEESDLRVIRIRVRLLLLPDFERQCLCTCIVTLSNAEDRMPHLVKPLVEEPIHWLPGCFLNRNPKLLGLHGLVRVLSKIVIYRAPPVLFP